MKKIFVLILVLLFCSCASKSNFSHSKAVFVSMKSAKLKFSEAGFVYNNDKIIKLELYKLAQPIITLDIYSSFICLNKICTSKKSFNKNIFGYQHYDDFINDIFNSKPIYNGENIIKTNCGFTQNIKNHNYDINYEICHKNTMLKDQKNKTIFSIKGLNT